MDEKKLLTRDALNRAARTLWTNVGVDAAVAVVTILLPVVTDAESWGELDWRLLGFSVTKTIVLVVFSFVMRRYLDGSRIPTPLPPTPVPAPNEDEPEADPLPRRALDEGDPLGR